MGANHARVLSDCEGVELVGVADSDPARVAKVVGGRTIPGFPDATRLLAETQPDMVCVVVPTSLHEPVAMQVIEAGATCSSKSRWRPR
jgi:predicted dehydrogenase